MKASGSSSSSSGGRSGGGKRKPPVPMQGRSKGKGTGASAKTPPTTAPTAAAAPIPPAAAAAPTAPTNPPPAVAPSLAAAAAAAPVSVSARRQEVLARFNASEVQRKEQIQRQRASMRQEVASMRMGSPSPRSAAKAVEASAKGGGKTGKRGVACPSPAAQEIESARGAGSVQAMASQFTGSSSVIETREMVMNRLMQEERTDRQARSAARELLAHFHGAHALFQGESHQAFLHRLKFESTAKEKALFLRAWARDRGLQGGAVSVAEGERFLRDIGLLSTGNNSDEKEGKEKGGGKKKKGHVASASAGAAGAGSRGGAAAPPSASSSVASVASSSSSSSSGRQRGPEATEQRNEEWMALLATAVNDATTAAAAAANSGSTTTDNNNGSGDDADIETVSSLSSASVAMPGGLSVSVPTAPRRRLFNGAAAAGVDEEEEEGEGDEEEEELGSFPSIETDVSLAPLMAGIAVGAGPSRSSSVATTGSVGSVGSNKAPAAVEAEQWSNVSQDGSYEGVDGEGEKPSGREAALVDGEEGEGVEGEEEDDEALRQLREKGFWFSDKMASLLPSTPSPTREGPAPKGKAPQE